MNSVNVNTCYKLNILLWCDTTERQETDVEKAVSLEMLGPCCREDK